MQVARVTWLAVCGMGEGSGKKDRAGKSKKKVAPDPTERLAKKDAWAGDKKKKPIQTEDSVGGEKKKPMQTADSASGPRKKYSEASTAESELALLPEQPPLERKSLNLRIRDAYTAVFVFAALAVFLVIWEVEIITRTIVSEGYEQAAVSGFIMRGEEIAGLIENDEETKLLKVCVRARARARLCVCVRARVCGRARVWSHFSLSHQPKLRPPWRTGCAAGLRDDSDSPVSALPQAADRV